MAIVTVTTIAAGRVALSALIARREGRELGSVGGAEVAIGAVMPAALASTLIAGAGFAALAGADLTVAREAGIAVAAGLVVDLILWRVPFFAFLARWGGE